jgi:Trk-type K+ transport system membrane component
MANIARFRSSRIVNLIVAVLMVLGGISQFFPIGLYVAHFVVFLSVG